jgi:hypothetical protein
VWDYGSPIPGILTTDWHPALKQRFLNLCGPLDEPLLQMLGEA